jgi:NAD(P)-dependent dehydrogenase (short-subunit alcohol dehydrogenase family)
MNKRTVVVTGGTGSLGTAVVEAFRRAGDEVIPVSRSSGEFSADLLNPVQVEELFRRVVDRHGSLDVLVHTAGAFAAGGDVEKTSPEIWTRMMQVNFEAALHTIRAALPHLGQGGRIVAVGSRAGVQLAAGVGAYSVSKAALNALIQTVALEVVHRGITANVVLPSTIDTEANRSWGTSAQQATWVTPESVADVILWLASEAAMDVNGALIPVYGRA